MLVGDATELLAHLPDRSVDIVLTSPPYFRLRDYGVDGQLGLEGDIEEWVKNLRGVNREVARLLTPTGSLWLNLGDSYATHPREGATRKSLLLGPERLLLALQADGWLVRNKIVWSKSNPVPSPVRDRLAATWEVVFFLTRHPRYFFDLDAIRQPHTSHAQAPRRPASAPHTPDTWRGPNAVGRSGLAGMRRSGRTGHQRGKNPGDVWRIASGRRHGSHHATSPLTLVERVICAACPEAVCSECSSPWTAGTAACQCQAPSRPGLVLDPFLGSGTTAVAANRLGRDWLGIELNRAFAAEAEQRIRAAGAERPKRSRSPP
ncbi:DNA-methyltransferase [Blastococcus colisei]|uniref:DNA-methyltransferase n=1 Tax=Blastococcus colisei TaxID=1564162 RepID=UPI001B866651|nr:site-specific DNA-methyltransferase [Blastococcus colisei]